MHVMPGARLKCRLLIAALLYCHNSILFLSSCFAHRFDKCCKPWSWLDCDQCLPRSLWEAIYCFLLSDPGFQLYEESEETKSNNRTMGRLALEPQGLRQVSFMDAIMPITSYARTCGLWGPQRTCPVCHFEAVYEAGDKRYRTTYTDKETFKIFRDLNDRRSEIRRLIDFWFIDY